MTFIWEIKYYFKKDFSMEQSMPTCLLFYYDLTLHPIFAWSQLFLQGMYKARHLSSTATAKGWKKAQQSLCFCHGLFKLQISTLLLYLSLFMFNLELQQKRNVGWRVDLRIPSSLSHSLSTAIQKIYSLVSKSTF